ncbi:MAG: hypothetical protein GY926_19055 [bacterium]|nr:hypothetical protein [bacterium]
MSDKDTARNPQCTPLVVRRRADLLTVASPGLWAARLGRRHAMAQVIGRYFGESVSGELEEDLILNEVQNDLWAVDDAELPDPVDTTVYEVLDLLTDDDLRQFVRPSRSTVRGAGSHH